MSARGLKVAGEERGVSERVLKVAGEERGVSAKGLKVACEELGRAVRASAHILTLPLVSVEVL